MSDLQSAQETSAEEKANGLSSGPGMPPVRRKVLARPQSPAKSSLFARYGKIGNTFQTFQDHVKHLQTPTPPAKARGKSGRPSKKSSNKVLPICPDPADNAGAPLVGTQQTNKKPNKTRPTFSSPYKVKQSERLREQRQAERQVRKVVGGGDEAEAGVEREGPSNHSPVAAGASSSGNSGNSPSTSKVGEKSHHTSSPPLPKKVDWKAFATDLTKDITFSQKRHKRRSKLQAQAKAKEREIGKAKGDDSGSATTPSPPTLLRKPEEISRVANESNYSPIQGRKLFDQNPLATGNADANERAKLKQQQGEVSNQDGNNKDRQTAAALKSTKKSFSDEKFPISSPTPTYVSHMYDSLEVASTSASTRQTRYVPGNLNLSWASHFKANGAVPGNRMGHSQTSVLMHLFVFGGATGAKFMNDLWIFNAETFTWCKKPSIGSVPSPRAYHTTTLLDYSRKHGDKTQKLLLFGGWNGRFMFNDMYVVDQCEGLLYRKSALFKQIKSENMPIARAMHTMTTLYLGDGEIGYQQVLVLFGGWSRQSFLNDMHVYNVAEESWSKVSYRANSPVPSARGSHSTVAIKDHLFIFGGQREEGPCNELWTFNIQTNQWTLVDQQGSQLPCARSGHACVLLEDRYILLFGGYNGEKHLSDMYMLDTDSMQWEQKCLPLGHPLGRSAHQLSLVGDTRVYMTFGWSPHGILCDIHGLDTRSEILKSVSVSGGPYSSTLCQLSVDFMGTGTEEEKNNKEKGRVANHEATKTPISIQWHRSKNGKPFAPIEGAITSVYMPTADDVNATLGVSCMPCYGKVPMGPSYFTQTQQIEIDPEMGGLVKSLVGQDKAKFSVNLLSSQNVVAKMYLIFTSSSFELRTKSKTSFKEEYQTSFRVILSSQNAHTFVLQVHQGLSLPFAVQHIMERDLLALTARAFWALALKEHLK